MPGKVSTMPPRAVQLVRGCDRLVEVNTPNRAFTLLVKANWKPLVVVAAWVSLGGTRAGTLAFTMLLVLWIPFTKTVASA